MDIKTKNALNAMYGRAAKARDHAVKISISLPSRLLKALDEAAAQFGLSRSTYISLLLNEYLISEPEDSAENN